MENKEMRMSSEKEKVTALFSPDDHIFMVEETMFVELRAIHRVLPAGNDAAILAKIIDYCRKPNNYKLNRLRAWYRNLVGVDEKILSNLFMEL